MRRAVSRSMKRLLCGLLFSILALCGRAQSYYVNGFIYDSFTGENLDSVEVVFMRPDSTVTERFISKKYGWWQFSENLKAPGKYIIRFSKKGYETTYKNVNFKYRKNRVTGGTFGEVLMRKKSTARHRVLSEAVVKATRIKMVMKGDTIVYNADAFQLRSGSMLDKLIAMLPGVELKPGGEIYVNGKKVQSLLVNGEDFFKGDPTVALKNLPSYMVDKVKVYERTPERMLALGMTAEDFKRARNPLVVDVNLKKEYSIGWIANATVGGGTDKHYNARAFALRFTPQSRLAFMGYSNDVYANSYYDTNGNWQSPGGNANIRTHELTSDLLVNDKRKRYKINNTVTFKATRQVTEELQNTVAYYGTGNVYGMSSRQSTSRNWFIRDYGTINVTPQQNNGVRFSPMNSRGISIDIKPNLYYSHYENRDQSRRASYEQKLAEHYMGEALDSLFFDGSSALYRQHLISSLQQGRHTEGYSLNAGAEATGTWKLQKMGGDFLDFAVGGLYAQGRNRELFGTSAYDGSDAQQRYAVSPTRSYNVHADAGYSYRLIFSKLGFWLTPEYSYRRQYRSADRSYYRLEQTALEDWDIDRLASTKDALTEYIDLSNSEYADNWKQAHRMGANINVDFYGSNNRKNNSIEVDLPVRLLSDRLDYERGQIDRLFTKHYTFFEPSVKYNFDYNDGSKHETHANVRYGMTESEPAATYLVDYRDDATPLVVRLGNSALRPTRRHEAAVSYSRYTYAGPRYRRISVSAQYNLWQDLLAQSVSYNEQNGVTTYRPVNINGNWGVNSQFSWYSTLDKKKRINFTATTNFNFRHSEDYAVLAGEAASSRILADRYITSERLNAYYAYNYYSWSATVNAEWTHSTSNRYSGLNALNISYGISGGVPLPGGFQLGTNLTLYSRYGYSNDNFNTNQLIWSANLSRSFFNGLMNVQLEAFDLLNKMSTYSYGINAQMQTETYRNVLRRYVMLNFTFRLNREPKKK